MSLFHAALQPALDADGHPISGATWSFYTTGTTTPAAVYANASLGTSLGSTVTANAAGRFATIFLSDAVTYRAILKDAGGTTIKDIDPANLATTVIDPGTITVAASASGAVPNKGLSVTMPTSGTGKDIGVKVTGGTGSGSGHMIVMEKNKQGGSYFLQAREYNVGGFLYADDGVGSATHCISTGFDSAGNLVTRKALIVSGTVNLNGTPSDPDNAAHAPEFVQASALPTMVTVYADVPVAIATRLPDSSPDDGTQVHWSINGFGGKEKLAVEKGGDFTYMDGWIPTASDHVNRASHEVFRTGRVGERGWGVKGMGFSCLNVVTMAQITAGIPDAYDLYDTTDGYISAGSVYVKDAATKGRYISDGRTFLLESNYSTSLGYDPLGWTTNNVAFAGNTITASGTKRFEKTAGTAAWNAAIYSTETGATDQYVAFKVDDISTLYMVGLATAAPAITSDDYYKAVNANLTGVFIASTSITPIVAGVVGTVLPDDTVAIGDILLIRKVGSTITVEKNGLPLTTLTTGAPAATRRGMAIFNDVGASVDELRWRVLA